MRGHDSEWRHFGSCGERTIEDLLYSALASCPLRVDERRDSSSRHANAKTPAPTARWRARTGALHLLMDLRLSILLRRSSLSRRVSVARRPGGRLVGALCLSGRCHGRVVSFVVGGRELRVPPALRAAGKLLKDAHVPRRVGVAVGTVVADDDGPNGGRHRPARAAQEVYNSIEGIAEKSHRCRSVGLGCPVWELLRLRCLRGLQSHLWVGVVK